MDKTSPPLQLIDIGLNLASDQFHHDADEVLSKAYRRGVVSCVLTGTNEQTSESVLRLCEQYTPVYPGKLYCTAGIHPHDAKLWRPNSSSRVLQRLLTRPQAVAVGETGLDFNRDYSPRTVQQRVFEAHLELAAKTGKPLFMHERDAHERQLEILKSYRNELNEGVIHCFTGDQKSLFNYLDLDLHIGITGWVCDERRGIELQRLIKNIPLDRLMLESDAPYLLPRTIRPKPRSRRNEPAYLPWVLKSIAEHREESAAVISAATTRTAIDFFQLDLLSD